MGLFTRKKKPVEVQPAAATPSGSAVHINLDPNSMQAKVRHLARIRNCMLALATQKSPTKRKELQEEISKRRSMLNLAGVQVPDSLDGIEEILKGVGHG